MQPNLNLSGTDLLALKKVMAFLGRVTYKPNWHFTAETYEPGSVYIRIRWAAPDSFYPERIANLTSLYSYSSNSIIEGGDKAIAGMVQHAISLAEMHEINEWFKIDGKFYKDPHPEFNNEVWVDNSNNLMYT